MRRRDRPAPRRWHIVAGSVGWLCLVSCLGSISGARADSRTPDPWGHMMCGPLSLKWAASRIGRDLASREVAEASHLTPQGASLADLKRAAESFGLEASGRRLGWDELKALGSPAILFLDQNHFVATDPGVAPDGSHIHVFDPDVGGESWSEEQLVEAWSGVALVISRPRDWPPSDGPRASFERRYRDVGVIPASRVQRVSFEIRNAGTAPLEIRNAKRNCRCLEWTLPAAPVGPGQSDSVDLVVDLSGGRGPFRAGLLLETNDPQSATLELVVEGVALDPDPDLPNELNLGDVVQGETVTSRIVFFDRGDGSTRDVTAIVARVATETDPTRPLTGSVSVRRLERGESAAPGATERDWAIDLSVAVGRDDALGRFEGRLVVTSAGGVETATEGEFHGRVVSRLHATPPALTCQFSEGDSFLDRRVVLTDHRGAPVTLAEVKVDPADSVTVVPEANAPAGGLALDVRCEREDLAPGVTNAGITLETADGGKAFVPVHIRAVDGRPIP